MPAFSVAEGLRELPAVVAARNLQISGQTIRIVTNLMRTEESARINADASIAGPGPYRTASVGARVDITA